MAPTALTNAFIYIGGHDFTADSNTLTLSCEGNANDKTTFRSGGWRAYNMGVKTSDMNVGAFWYAGTDAPDDEVWNNTFGLGQVTTLADVETEGMPAYMLQSMAHNYQLLGQHGENAPFTLQGACKDGLGVIRGQLALAMADVSATGAVGTALELGAVDVGEYLYATFHVFGTPGTTITAVVESAADNTFASATTRITFGPYTTAGGRWGIRVAGSVTDTWYRLRITAITGTFAIACAIAVQ